MTNNGTISNPFGISFDLANFSQTTTNFATLPSNTILHGSAGNPTAMNFSNGTSITINKNVNANALGLVFKTGFSKTGSTGIMLASSRYGSGKVVGLGDSSPADDGTGDLNDVLYNGWSGEVSGDHKRIILNATIWLSNTSVAKENNDFITNEPVAFNVYPNPATENISIEYTANADENSTIYLYDMVGKRQLTNNVMVTRGYNNFTLDISALPQGSYILQIVNSGNALTKRFIKAN